MDRNNAKEAGNPAPFVKSAMPWPRSDHRGRPIGRFFLLTLKVEVQLSLSFLLFLLGAHHRLIGGATVRDLLRRSQVRVGRRNKRRPNPFAAVWDEVRELLDGNAGLQAK